MSEVVEAGGETDWLDAVLGIGLKFCVVGTDSAREEQIMTTEVVVKGVETVRVGALSEIGDAGNETGQMNVLSEAQESGGSGEVDGRDDLSRGREGW